MIRFGVIGSGWIAEEFVKGAELVEGFEFSAMYSRTYEKGKAFADKFKKVQIYTDLNEFAGCDIDAVYIASPNSLHYSQSKLMLENGKHVLCEKPITITPDELDELSELAKAKGLIYTEAIMMLHQPARKAVKKALGEIGEITSAHFDFSQLSSKYAALKAGENPNIFNPDMYTGCLRDLGIYCFYPAIDFFGMPEEIISTASFVETGADGSGTTVLKYRDKLVTLTYSKTGQDKLGSQIIGDKGTLTFESISKLAGVYLCRAENDDETLVYGLEPKHILMSREAEDFYKYIHGENLNEYHENNDIIRKVCSIMYYVKNKCGIK